MFIPWQAIYNAHNIKYIRKMYAKPNHNGFCDKFFVCFFFIKISVLVVGFCSFRFFVCLFFDFFLKLNNTKELYTESFK